VPRALDEVILAALARDPDQRTGSAEALRTALAGQWLDLARDQGEQDLRGLMQRLWPDGDLPSLVAEATALRPASSSPRPPVPAVDRSVATRLAPAGRRRRAVLSLLVVAVLAGAWGWHRLAVRDGGEAARTAEPAPAGDPPSTGHGLWVLGGLDAAAAARGEGVVQVHVVPWAVVRVDGVPVGETPQELRLRAGPHGLRVEHPALGAAELELDVAPGRRQLWRPALKR
jgi:hypothetical protein